MKNQIYNLSDSAVVNISNSSEGNQLKWKKNNCWFKADINGLESLSEIICSRLAHQLNFPYQIADYYPCEIIYNHQKYRGCYSFDFAVKPIITLNKLYSRLTMHNIYDAVLSREISAEQRIGEVFEVLHKVPQSADLCRYVSSVIVYDEIILNTDRHAHNILFYIDESTGLIEPAPLFDNGEALLSNLKKYDGTDIKGYCYNAKAKPFSRSFKTQTMAVRKYYDVKYNPDNLSYEKLYEGLEDYYTKDEIFRALRILQFQVNRLQERSID